MTTQAWNLLAVFVATIVGIITNPLPLGAVAMIGLGVSMTTGLLPFSAAFSAFSSEIPWLIALAFFLARGFIKTGLGNRIAYKIVSLFGKSTLGLTYSLVFSEALLAPAIPFFGRTRGWYLLAPRQGALRRVRLRSRQRHGEEDGRVRHDHRVPNLYDLFRYVHHRHGR